MCMTILLTLKCIYIPNSLHSHSPSMHATIPSITIPMQQKDDIFLWTHSTPGCLTLKDAYFFMTNTHPNKECAKLIQNPFIPPSISTIIWRIIYYKMPRYVNLAIKGCHVPSMCSLCKKNPFRLISIYFFNVTSPSSCGIECNIS